jgi:cytochrome b pre-mRNA-processing protein 3
MAKNRARRLAAERLLATLVARARAPIFFRELGVADTVDGRFDLIALHASLLLERLEAAGRRDLSQALIDKIFTSFDEGLRDLGAGDIGIGKRIQKMADAFYGRMQAYAEARDEAALATAIKRNVFREALGHEDAAHVVAQYVLSARNALGSLDPDSDEITFGPLPAAAKGTR